MGKKKKIKKNKKIERMTAQENNIFRKNLIDILPLIILLAVTINIFIFYYLPSLEGLSYLYNLFYSGNFIIHSSILVAIILALQVLILKDLDKKTMNVLYVYVFISGFHFAAAPSFLFNMILSNKLIWTGYLIAEYLWELAVFVIIINTIKNYRQKNSSTTKLSQE